MEGIGSRWEGRAGLLSFEVALVWLPLVLVLVLNEMVLVLDAVSSSTSTANAEYEYEYEYETPPGIIRIRARRNSKSATPKRLS